MSAVCPLTNPLTMPVIRSLTETTTRIPALSQTLRTIVVESTTTTVSTQKVVDEAIRHGARHVLAGAGMSPIGWVLMFLLSVLAVFCLLIGAYALYDEKCRSNDVMKQNVSVQTSTESGPFRNNPNMNRRRNLQSSHV
ncbi:unnamed protein product [Bursaphelenchus okinawaensis]|uniref:Uncharacterized protein n=1 Tax=Bursaphelenchus okinawaensis TaxID=465554 RepID=A0A811JXC4_9BILA|nr:unnamed protein product [Bursaphelenchus okinawaensis]CAG9086812.1 unnamed protein product [Bursaphelenchus okinawaensis]